jgi:predicted ABC-type ATPase
VTRPKKDSTSSKPNVYVVAGPNGAGKTTFAQRFLPAYAECTNFVNADLIAQGVSPFAPEQAALRAGKRVDFGFETTLAGRTQLKILLQLKHQGYHLHLFFLWLPNLRFALSRIRGRVQS